MARSEVDLLNEVLSFIGLQPMASLADARSNDETAAVLRAFGTSLESALSKREWTFALRNQRLSPLSNVNSPKAGSKVFDVPNDCVRIAQGSQAIERFGTYILSTSEFVDLNYVSSDIDYNAASPKFLDYVVYDTVLRLSASRDLTTSFVNIATTLREEAYGSAVEEDSSLSQYAITGG